MYTNNQNMNTKAKKTVSPSPPTIITAGSTYLDIDAYACAIAMAELLSLHGIPAIAYSTAPFNYSICKSLTSERPLTTSLPMGCDPDSAQYIIVDVSDPDYIKDSVPLCRVAAVYDHHTGFEDYWHSRIGEHSHIEFIGAAATLVVREWKRADLFEKMSSTAAKLLIAAILDNTLNLTSSNTTPEDVETFRELCRKERVGDDWCAAYFSEVQESVEADLQNALLNDTKTVRDNDILPHHVAQITVWDANSVLARLSEIRQWFGSRWDGWMINIIDIQHHCSYFVCDDEDHQKKIGGIFAVRFDSGVALSSIPYLRKEIIKKTKL